MKFLYSFASLCCLLITSHSYADYKITPLIESASITLTDKTSTQSATLFYRIKGSSDWINGNKLYWDPASSSLSGSLVYLEPNTEYQVGVMLYNNGSLTGSKTYEFKTRPNSPTIDSSKVYYLSDIYSGGELDLDALGIEGSADGWAKIIGDADTPIENNSSDSPAINIGDNSYIYFENITVKGGYKHAIESSGAHHLWFNGCEISNWGRKPNYEKNGIYYETEADMNTDENYNKGINLDSAFNLSQTGFVVIENCDVHSPRAKSNYWHELDETTNVHPMGPSAVLVDGRTSASNKEYEGQIIIRNNHFYGTDSHRFNDVITNNRNAATDGGFVRDSAIYNNVFEYANDDLIEIDGSQQNVLVYDNELTNAYCGISATPNFSGPSYIFNNNIHSITDEIGKTWAGIKLGGYLSSTSYNGMTNIFNNFVRVNNNGISSSNFERTDVSTKTTSAAYWANVRNNTIIHKNNQSIRDSQHFEGSKFINNFMYNIASESRDDSSSEDSAAVTIAFYYPELLATPDKAKLFWNLITKSYAPLKVPSNLRVQNFTKSVPSEWWLIKSGKTN